MMFFGLTLLGVIVILVLGIRNQFAATQSKKYLRAIGISAIVASLMVGYLEGTWYSHGFDIPWWVFSILSFSVYIAIAFALVLIVSRK